MMSDRLGDILTDLGAAIEREGVRGYARRVGLSATFVSAVARRQALPGPKIIEDLGYVEDGRRFVRRKQDV